MKDTDIPIKVRMEVLERDSFPKGFEGVPCCIYCGAAYPGGGLHLHHVKRRSQGGTGTADNLVSLCWKCHRKLHDGDGKIQKFCEDYLRRFE